MLTHTFDKNMVFFQQVFVQVTTQIVMSTPNQISPKKKKNRKEKQKEQLLSLKLKVSKIKEFFFFRGVGCPRSVMVKAMDCGIVVHEFVLQLRYYVHFRANTHGKGMNPLILPAMG